MRQVQCNAEILVLYKFRPSYPQARILRKLEAKACHTAFILVNRSRAVLLWISRIAEQHTLVARSFLVFAHAAWLVPDQHIASLKKLNLGTKANHTLTLAAASPAGLRSCAMLAEVAVAVARARQWVREEMKEGDLRMEVNLDAIFCSVSGA